MSTIHNHTYPTWLITHPLWIRWLWKFKITVYPRTQFLKKRLLDLNPIFSNSIWIDLGAGDGEFSFLGDAKASLLLDKSADNIEFLRAYSMRKFRGSLNIVDSSDIADSIRIQQCDLNNSEELKAVLEWGKFNKSFDNTELDWRLKPETQNQLIANSNRIFTLFSVLQYVSEPDRVLSDLHAIMSQNDLLILYIPVNQHQHFGLYKWMFQRFANYEILQNRQHIFKTPVLLKLLSECGFKVVELQKLYGKWGIPSHELNSMCFMAMSHSNFLVKLLGILSYLWVWPLIQVLNGLERMSWNKNHDSSAHVFFEHGKFENSTVVKNEYIPVNSLDLSKHNGLYVELKKR